MGKSRYVIHCALTLGLTTVGALDVLYHIFNWNAQPESLLFRFFSSTITGIWTGFYTWKHWEATYEKALLEASAGGHALPHNQVKQVSN